jgi:hypothetical protein
MIKISLFEGSRPNYPNVGLTNVYISDNTNGGIYKPPEASVGIGLSFFRHTCLLLFCLLVDLFPLVRPRPPPPLFTAQLAVNADLLDAFSLGKTLKYLANADPDCDFPKAGYVASTQLRQIVGNLLNRNPEQRWTILGDLR